MKFTWGTGIFVFLIMFLLAAAFFIFFAMRQDVSLVHDDYYEQGVAYAEQMNVNTRSLPFKDSVETRFEGEFLVVDLHRNPEMKIDSGSALLYRPSSSSLDIKVPFDVENGTLNIPGSELYKGRYILKLFWYSAGLKYEVDKAIDVP